MRQSPALKSPHQLLSPKLSRMRYVLSIAHYAHIVWNVTSVAKPVAAHELKCSCASKLCIEKPSPVSLAKAVTNEGSNRLGILT